LKWKPVILVDGAKGPIVAQIAALRVIRNNDGVPGKELWLFLRKDEDGKKHSGMDQYEQRTWTAWHRHMLFIFLAMYFLLRLRIKYKKNSIEYIASNKKAGISNIT